jgi:hypothetical protein
MRACIAVLLLFISSVASAQQAFRIYGYLDARGIRASGQPSWLSGGFGRLESAANSTGDDAFHASALAQLGADWTPNTHFDLHVQGLARQEPDSSGTRRAGIPEAYADVRGNIASDTLQLRAGAFFLPTSRENKDDLWTSPYSITFSSLNSWIAEELRPVGADLEWKHPLASGNMLTFGATAFRGDDTAGALLAWRGWSLGSRLSVYGETLPLPPLFSFRDTSIFGRQRNGTLAFGRDLDGRTGISARARWQIPERLLVQITRVDNRGDRQLHRGEYAWQTRMTIVSSEFHPRDRTSIAAEYASGTSGMGVAPSFVQMTFYSAYLLASQQLGRNRLTARFDVSQTDDRDHSRGETDTDHMRGLTLAWLYDVNAHVRAGLELVNVSAQRVAAAESGFDPNTDGRTLTAQLRYRFGSD